MNQEPKVENPDVENPKFESGNAKPAPRVPLFADEPQTLAGLFLYAARNHNRPDALNYKAGDEWRPISSDEIIARAERIALGLYSFGLRKGDKAAILANNSPAWTLTDAGCQFAGVIDVPIYTTLAPAAIGYILKDSESKVVFLENKATYDRIREILPECARVEKLIFFEPAGIEIENALSLTELEDEGEKLRTGQPDLAGELVNAVTSNDVATLIYTSGTTGEPKGVMLSHQNLVSNVIDVGEKHTFNETDVSLSVLPLSHVFERTGMNLNLFRGVKIHYAESIDKVPANLAEVRPTIFAGVPRIFEKVYATAKLKAAEDSRFKEKIFDWAVEVAKAYALKKERGEKIPRLLAIKHAIADRLVYSKLRQFFGGRLHACITGGAALSEDISLIFTGAGLAIYQGYGMTETSPVVTANNPIESRLGTVGKPIRNVRVRLAEDGEIEVSGPNVMLGYYNKPEATRESFTADGWLKTGDIGTIDEDGFLRITDRKKELFKTSGGKYIAPSPIEEMIKASRFVSQVVLVGDERKFPAALIVPNFEQLRSYAKTKGLDPETPEEFIRHPQIVDLFEREVADLTKNLSNYEKIKKIALLPKELTIESGELTPTLKVKRRVINEKYKDVIDKIYADAEKEKSAS